MLCDGSAADGHWLRRTGRGHRCGAWSVGESGSVRLRAGLIASSELTVRGFGPVPTVRTSEPNVTGGADLTGSAVIIVTHISRVNITPLVFNMSHSEDADRRIMGVCPRGVAG